MKEENNKIVEQTKQVAKDVQDFLIKFYKKVKHLLGVLFVDKWMRNVVMWYDKRHPMPTRHKTKQDNLQIKELLNQVKVLEKSNSDLKESLSHEKESSARLSQEKNTLSKELEQSRNEVSSMTDRLRILDKEVIELQQQNISLMSRCLPESEIPSMIYYAEGDASGLGLRKISAKQTDFSIYLLKTKQGDACSAEFVPSVKSNIQEVINNRSVTLIACEILSIVPNATDIKVVTSGNAIFENNMWKVVRKAKIQLI